MLRERRLLTNTVLPVSTEARERETEPLMANLFLFQAKDLPLDFCSS